LLDSAATWLRRGASAALVLLAGHADVALQPTAPPAAAPPAAPAVATRKAPRHRGTPPHKPASDALEPGAPPWRTSLFHYSTGGSPLADAFAELSRAAGVPIAVDPAAHGEVAGRFVLPPQRMLELLARSFNLDWYYDGVVLRVTPHATLAHLAVRLNFAAPEAVRETLQREHIVDPRHPLRIDRDTRVLSTSGPPAYVALVVEAIRVEEDSARTHTDTQIEVVTLRAAEAFARSAPNDADAAGPPGGVVAMARRRLVPHLPSDAIELAEPLPAIVANPDTNTVLIRDRPEHLGADAQVVRALDVATEPVVIGALVAELDADALPPLALDEGSVPGSTPLAHATLDDGGRELRAQIAALRAAGHAQIGIDDALRTLDTVSVGYAQRPGRRVAQVDGNGNGNGAGFALEVRPHVLARERSGASIELDVGFGRSGALARARAGLRAGQALLLLQPLDAQGRRVRIALLAPRA
jgi:hypothetical protein